MGPCPFGKNLINLKSTYSDLFIFATGNQDVLLFHVMELADTVSVSLKGIY